MLNLKLHYLEFTNLVELILYILSLILTLNYPTYTVNDIKQLTATNLTQSDITPLEGFQQDTGLRQVRSL